MPTAAPAASAVDAPKELDPGLGREVFRTYGKFIREDYQKPKPALRAVS